jgi:DNA polymerase-3 subunit epsilon
MSWGDYIISFDTETTGLMGRGAKYHELDKFNNCRLVSISWVIIQRDNLIITEMKDMIVKPADYKMGATEIHGITYEKALEGVDIEDVFDEIERIFELDACIIAYNLNFDEKVLLSEFTRYDRSDLIEVYKKKKTMCSYLFCRKYIVPKISSYKLSNVHEHLFNERFDSAHSSLEDAIASLRCYIFVFEGADITDVIINLDELSDGKFKGYANVLSKKAIKFYNSYYMSHNEKILDILPDNMFIVNGKLKNKKSMFLNYISK